MAFNKEYNTDLLLFWNPKKEFSSRSLYLIFYIRFIQNVYSVKYTLVSHIIGYKNILIVYLINYKKIGYKIYKNRIIVYVQIIRYLILIANVA